MSACGDLFPSLRLASASGLVPTRPAEIPGLQAVPSHNNKGIGPPATGGLVGPGTRSQRVRVRCGVRQVHCNRFVGLHASIAASHVMQPWQLSRQLPAFGSKRVRSRRSRGNFEQKLTACRRRPRRRSRRRCTSAVGLWMDKYPTKTYRSGCQQATSWRGPYMLTIGTYVPRKGCA